MSFLQPAVKGGIFDVWVDRQMESGADWDPEIETKLRACDVFILLVSVNSMASNYIIDKEIAIIRERQANRELVYFYPLLLTPTSKVGLDKVRDKNLRPRGAKPLSGYLAHDRAQHMADTANEIASIAEDIRKQKAAAQAAGRSLAQPAPSPGRHLHVDTTGLPETGNERHVGVHPEANAWVGRNMVNGRFKRVWSSVVHIKYVILSLAALLAAYASYAYAPWIFSKMEEISLPLDEIERTLKIINPKQ
jgi:hypothetical protein